MFNARYCLLGCLAALIGCDAAPDPRTLEGALAYVAWAVEREDPKALYQVVDPRARHAMISIVHDRQAAAALIRESYPEREQARALASLGDGAEVDSAAALFARRCPKDCQQALAARVGAPTEVEEEGPLSTVTTARGGTLRFYRAKEGDWYGLVFETEALADERAHANRDLGLITQNAETYARRRALEAQGGAPQTPGR